MSTSRPDQSLSSNTLASPTRSHQSKQSQGPVRILAPPSRGSRILGKTSQTRTPTLSTSSVPPMVKAIDKDSSEGSTSRSFSRVKSLDDWQPGNGFSTTVPSKGRRERSNKGPTDLVQGVEKSGSAIEKSREVPVPDQRAQSVGGGLDSLNRIEPEKQEGGIKQQALHQKQQRQRWTPDSDGDVKMNDISSTLSKKTRMELPSPTQSAGPPLPTATRALFPIPPPPSLLSPTARSELARTYTKTRLVTPKLEHSSLQKLLNPLANPRSPIHVVKPEPSDSPHPSLGQPRTEPNSPSPKSLILYPRARPKGSERSEFARRQPDLLAQLENTDWSKCDPRFLPYLIFRIEYLRVGHPTYQQNSRRPFVRNNERFENRLVVAEKPSWDATCDLKTLLKRFGSEELTAVLWIRDLLEVDGEEQVGGSGLVRQTSVRDVRMFLVGKEFPFRNVVVVGILIGAEYVTKQEQNRPEYRAWHFVVDDSTGVIQVVSLESGRRVISNNSDSPIPIGSLVRLTGALEETAYRGRRIQADKIEQLKDANLESQHHLTVQALHRDVYGRTVELDSLLKNIRQEEKSWAGSQATASEAGTPKKAKPLRKAKRLDPDDLQANFQPYIKHFLRRLFLHTINPNAEPEIDVYAPNVLIKSHCAIAVIPSEFLLEDLKDDSDLHDFAVLLAQKLEKDKRKRRSMRIDAAGRGGSWSREIGEESIIVSKPAGWVKGGSAKILPGPTSQRISKKTKLSKGEKSGDNRSAEQQKEDAPLKEGALIKAVHQLFRNALIEMRKAGLVVLAIEGEIEALQKQAELANKVESDTESSHVWPSSPELKSSGYDPHRINKTTYNRRSDAGATSFNKRNLDHFYSETARLAANSGAPWPLLTGNSALPKLSKAGDKSKRRKFQEEEEDYDTPKAKRKGKKVAKVAKVRGPGDAPWDLIVVSESEEEESEIGPKLLDFTPKARKKPFVSDSVTPRARQVGEAPWDLIMTSREDESDDQIVTPRFIKKAPTKVPKAEDSPFVNKNPYIRSPIKFGIEKSLEEIQSTSIFQIDTESWLLVTPFLLNNPILSVISEEYQRVRMAYRSTAVGVSEAHVKLTLAQDSRWECVAENQRMIGKAIEDLEERGLIERVGSLLRPCE